MAKKTVRKTTARSRSRNSNRSSGSGKNIFIVILLIVIGYLVWANYDLSNFGIDNRDSVEPATEVGNNYDKPKTKAEVKVSEKENVDLTIHNSRETNSEESHIEKVINKTTGKVSAIKGWKASSKPINWDCRINKTGVYAIELDADLSPFALSKLNIRVSVNGNYVPGIEIWMMDDGKMEFENNSYKLKDKDQVRITLDFKDDLEPKEMVFRAISLKQI